MMRLTLAALTALLMTSPASKAEQPAVSVKDKFYVYGGGCSRSIRLQATCDTIREACAAAEKFRDKDKLRFVTVRTGAHEKDYFGSNATQYKVYHNPCKGWSLHATVQKVEKAKEIADTLKKNGEQIEIVLYYAPR